MHWANQRADLRVAWRGKGLIRALLLLVAAAVIAALAVAFGIAHDYGYLRASILAGSPEGYYHALATRLAGRANREHGTLLVIPTAGSIENVTRLADQASCDEMFAPVQDGTPIHAETRLELLGQLPDPESLILLGRVGQTIHTLADLRGFSIGIGPEGSGTAYLMKQIFADADLRDLGIRLSQHALSEQAQLVAQGQLDLAAFVMQEDAEFLTNIIRQHNLDVIAPQDLSGIVARHPWLSLGRIQAGRFDVVRHIPGFVRGNPPSSTSPATPLPLAREAHQFFLTGEPEIADRYFPWLVNLMSPAYWVYLVMAATVLFNMLRAWSKFRLWRIDAAREKLETAFKELAESGLTHAQMRANATKDAITTPDKRAAAEAILKRLAALRARCQQQTSSFVTPMGDEMFYRYQQSLIDEVTTTVGALLQRPSTPATSRPNPTDRAYHYNQSDPRAA